MVSALSSTMEGMVFEPLSNRPFSLHDATSVWVVERGRLYVFLSRMQDGECEEARHPVTCVEQGNAIFGMHLKDGVPSYLIASAAPETRILRLSQQRIRELAALGDPSAIEMLESWIRRLGTALSTSIPHTAVNLEPGQILEIAGKTGPVIPKTGLIWVFHRKGSSEFLADPCLPAVNHGAYFPVSSHAWLQPHPGSVLECIGSGQLGQFDSEWRSLDVFHEMALCALNQQQLAMERKEQGSLRAKIDSDTALMDHSILQLASVLAPKHAAVAVPEECVQDPLLLACQTACRRINVKITPARNLPAGAVHKEPIVEIAKASGLRLRRVVLKGEWWKHDGIPLVAFRENGHQPVALLPRKLSGYELYDPAEPQSMRQVDAEIAHSLNPFAYVFYRPFPAKKITGRELLLFGFKGCEAELLAIFCLSIASGVVAVAIPYATGVIFDVLLPGAEREQLLQMTAFLVIAAIATGLFALGRGFTMLRLEGKMDAALQSAVWDRLLSLPLQFFRDYSAGDLAMRSLGIAQIRQRLTGSTLNTILSSIFSIFSLAILFYYEWRLALLASGLLALGLLISLVLGYFQVRLQRRIFKLRGHIAGTVLQFVSGISKLRESGAEGRAFVAWVKQFSSQKQQSLQARRIINSITTFTSVYPTMSLALIFSYHSYLISGAGRSNMTTGDFVAFLTAFIQSVTAMSLLSTSLVSLANIVPLYERAQPILHTLPEVTEARTDPGQLRGAIEMNHVRFRYAPDAPLVLRGFSAIIQPGEMVAFVGPSGCGKSTIFRLLLGFETPESGAIYYDGKDLSGLDVQTLRRQLGVVLQSSRLLSGDIFTNIVGSSPLTLDDAWEAARMAGIEDDIRRMPMGMHTVISEGGGGISGGQRQRLLLARAIVNRPRILLLDEATSALDNRTQAIVSRSLESLHATRIVIAHRLSTIISAHRIYVIDRGEVVQCGTYEELLKQKGLFQELAHRQLL